MAAAAPGTKPSAAAAAAAAAATASRQQRAVSGLSACMMLRNFAVMVRLQNEQDIWFTAFGSNFAGMARAQGTLSSIAGAVGFVIGPLLGGVSDAYGRRPLMVLSQALSAAVGVLITIRPSIPMLVVRQLLMPVSSEPWEAGYQAALADLFADDAAAYGRATARLGMVMSVNNERPPPPRTAASNFCAAEKTLPLSRVE